MSHTGRRCHIWKVGGGTSCYLFGLRAAATAGLWSENRSAGSGRVAPTPSEKEEALQERTTSGLGATAATEMRAS